MQSPSQFQGCNQSESQMMQCPPCQAGVDAALPFWLEDDELPEHRQYMFQYHTQLCAHFQNGYCPRHKLGKSGQMQCFCYHYESQRRRPLVDSMVGQIRYWDVMCEKITNGVECPMGDMCQFAHTKEEISYHVGKYKTKLCHIKECRGQDVCCFAHGETELRNHAPERYSFWHICGANGVAQAQVANSQEGDIAGLASSSMGALYHPKVYKHRFCASFPDVAACKRGTACAFAHSREEIRTALLTEDEEKQELFALTDNFFMYKFKTLWCPVGVQHDWQSCVYAHNYQDARRHPGIEYGPRPCPYWKRKETSLEYAQRCPLGVRCPYSHGAKEQLYHPSYFKSVTCQDGPSQQCPRGKLCAFWHKKSQQRTQSVGDADFDYQTPITEDKLKQSLQPDFLLPPFELLSCLQNEVKGMKRMATGFGPQEIAFHQGMGSWSMAPHGMVFSYGTGTPTTAADSEEASGGDSANGSETMPRNQIQMSNGIAAQAMVPSPMGAMIPAAMGGMYPQQMYTVPWTSQMGPYGMQTPVVYCVPVAAGNMHPQQANFEYTEDDDCDWNAYRPHQQLVQEGEG